MIRLNIRQGIEMEANYDNYPMPRNNFSNPPPINFTVLGKNTNAIMSKATNGPIKVDGELFNLSIRDDSSRDYKRNTDVYFLTFNITNTDSIRNVYFFNELLHNI
jgi:hypothetical protein